MKIGLDKQHIITPPKPAPVAYKIAKMLGEDGHSTGRYMLVHSDTGKVLDNMRGYGYKTYQSADRAGWYKYKGGAEQLEADKKAADIFWEKHEYFATLLETFDGGDLSIIAVAEDLGIEDFSLKFLKYR